MTLFMKTAAMRDWLTHTLDVPMYYVVLVEILYGLCYTEDLTKS
jgi:hypothetical protein